MEGRCPQRPKIKVAGDGDPPEKIENEIMIFFDRKRPIHIHPIGRDNMPIILFLTVCSKDKQKKFNNSKFHDAVRKAWIEADAWKTGYYMIMPDHMPIHSDDPEDRQAFAFGFGYIKALIQAVNSEV